MTTKPIQRVLSSAARHASLARSPGGVLQAAARDVQHLDDFKLVHRGVLKKAREVQASAYKVKAYMRLVPWQDLVLSGRYASPHVVEAAVGIHFARRFPAMTTITVNVSSGTCCVSPAASLSRESAGYLQGWAVRRPVPAWRARLLGHPGACTFFQVDRCETIEGVVGSLVALLHPREHASIGFSIDKHEFMEEWMTFYDSQLVESRTNYPYATRMLGIAHAKDQLDPGDVVIQRVIKRIPRNQRTLLDFSPDVTSRGCPRGG